MGIQAGRGRWGGGEKKEKRTRKKCSEKGKQKQNSRQLATYDATCGKITPFGVKKELPWGTPKEMYSVAATGLGRRSSTRAIATGLLALQFPYAPKNARCKKTASAQNKIIDKTKHGPNGPNRKNPPTKGKTTEPRKKGTEQEKLTKPTRPKHSKNTPEIAGISPGKDFEERTQDKEAVERLDCHHKRNSCRTKKPLNVSIVATRHKGIAKQAHLAPQKFRNSQHLQWSSTKHKTKITSYKFSCSDPAVILL